MCSVTVHSLSLSLTSHNGTLWVHDALSQRGLSEGASACEAGSILTVGDSHTRLLVTLLLLLQADGKSAAYCVAQSLPPVSPTVG